MRLFHLIKNELFLLYKQGILVLYAIFTALYCVIVASLNGETKIITGVILVFTDPAAMGLFFMGAMVLFEKSQRVESSLGVSPIKPIEYVMGKVIPLMIVGVIVGGIISLIAYPSFFWVNMIGVIFSSILFSIAGLIVASMVKSLNGFILLTIPFEIIISLPAILSVFEILNSDLWLLHPGIAAIRLMKGNMNHCLLGLLSILFWILVLLTFAIKATKKSFSSMEGAKI